MKKSSILLVIISAILILSTFSFVSAAPSGAQIANSISGFFDDVSVAVKPVFSLILGDVSGTGAHGDTFYLLAKLLIFLLIGSFVLSVFDASGMWSGRKNRWRRWMVVIIFDILAVRFLDANTIAAIILPYSAVAVALTAILPFVVYAFAMYQETQSQTLRRLGWIFFAAIFIVLWTVRYEELGGARWVYVVTAGAALIMIMIDGTIARLFMQIKGEKFAAEGRTAERILLKSKMRVLDRKLAEQEITPEAYEIKMKELTEAMTTLNKQTHWTYAGPGS